VHLAALVLELQGDELLLLDRLQLDRALTVVEAVAAEVPVKQLPFDQQLLPVGQRASAYHG
jgi:hypothetical protein